MKPKSILELKVGQSALIDQVGGQGSIRQRLLDMGLLPKRKLQLERFAPRGGPVWVKLKGIHLALRREEAAVILVSDILVLEEEKQDEIKL